MAAIAESSHQTVSVTYVVSFDIGERVWLRSGASTERLITFVNSQRLVHNEPGIDLLIYCTDLRIGFCRRDQQKLVDGAINIRSTAIAIFPYSAAGEIIALGAISTAVGRLMYLASVKRPDTHLGISR